MDAKQVLGFILTLAGMGGLGYGIISIFEGSGATNGAAWAAAILGGIFFFAGIGLIRSVKSTSS